MSKGINKANLLKRLEKLNQAAPKSTPYIIFVNDLEDGTVEIKEHIGVGTSSQRNRLYNSIKINTIIITTQKEFDNYLDKIDFPNCTIIMGDLALED